MPITIEQIKELMERATPGPWGTQNHPNVRLRIYGKGVCVCEAANDDARFIVALPEIAQLCLSQAEEIERLKLTIRGKTFTE